MSDKPKFEVIDRRKMKAEEEHENQQQPATPAEARPAPGGGPHLVVNESNSEARRAPAVNPEPGAEAEAELPPAPTAQESREQKVAYDASSKRLEDMVRAQNPAAGVPPRISFEHLVQQFHFWAMIQMGAGAEEGKQRRVDVIGLRQTIDMLGVLADKTRGNLTEDEDRLLQAVLFDLRMTFLEVTRAIVSQGVQPPPPPKKA